MKKFDEELVALKTQLITMGETAERMIGEALRALLERDTSPIDDVMTAEETMDHYDVEIDDEAIRLLTIYSPVASDLRLLLMVSRISAELERVGDQAVNMCTYIKLLVAEEPLKPLIDLPRMGELAMGMVRKSLRAFVDRDVLLAKEVIDTDDQVDELNDQIFRELLSYVASSPVNMTRAVALILTARSLERMADHATNIGEEVIFLVLGKNIRHLDEEEITDVPGGR